jgi:serine/threonine-protein kinase HipA
MDTLNVFHGERHIGWLRYDAKEEVYLFEYDPKWREDATAFDLAPLLQRKDTRHSGSTVRFFFSNLLPEGEMLEIVSRAHGISKYDPFGLLRKIGAECAGALKILDADTASPDGRTYKLVPQQELSGRARPDSQTPFVEIGGKLRMSLAGVQDKLPSLVDRGNRVYVPDLGSASTHILKPNIRRRGLFPHTTVNEHFCMELARRMRIPAANSSLLSVPERIYFVERCDRLFKPPLVVEERDGSWELRGEPVHRLHQIDVCQLLGIPPTQKYEEPEYEAAAPGPDIGTVVGAIRDTTAQPLVATRTIIDWVIFNYLIGNSDSHAKNISILWRDGRWTLAPAYDQVSVAAYSEDREKLHDFAFRIGTETRYAWITGASWYGFSKSIGINYRYVQAALERMSRLIGGEADKLLRELLPQLSKEEQDVLHKVVRLITEHASYAKESGKTINAAARKSRSESKPVGL